MPFFIGIFGFCSLWDAFTTFYGSYQLLGGGFPQGIMSFFAALAVLTTMLMTVYIFENLQLGEFLDSFMRLVWFVAFLFDLYTSFVGNMEFVIKGDLTAKTIIFLVMTTFVISGSPIVVSLLWSKQNR